MVTAKQAREFTLDAYQPDNLGKILDAVEQLAKLGQLHYKIEYPLEQSTVEELTALGYFVYRSHSFTEISW